MNKRIKKLRETLNLTPELFGERIGVTETAMEHIEKGEYNTTDQIISTICREFGVDETWLRTGKGSMLKIITNDDLDLLSQQYNLTSFERLTLEKYLELPISERAAVADLITKKQK